MALLLNLLLIIPLFLSFFTANSADPMAQFCNQNSNVSATSQISSNIDALLSILVQQATQFGYNSNFYGRPKDRVYGLAQCRADVSRQECSSCIKDAAQQIRTLCPSQADATIWYDYCFLRYSTNNFIGNVETSYGFFFANVENFTDPEAANKELGELVDEIRLQAVAAVNNGFGKGERKLSEFVTLYALGQCTRDLSPVNCAQCLAIAVGNVFPGFCKDKKGCRVLYGSCYVRYELYPIFFPIDSNGNSTNSSKNKYVSAAFNP